MSYSFQGRITPEFTPKPIRYVLYAVAIISIGAALIDPLLAYYTNYGTLQNFLPLSTNGVSQRYFWQVISYLFIVPSFGGIDIFYLLHLAFQLYMFWILATAVFEFVGYYSFLRLFLGGGALLGIITSLFINSFNLYGILYGLMPINTLLFTLWVMLYPKTEVRILFIFLAQARWIWLVFAVAFFLISLSQSHFIDLTAHSFSLIFGYLYGLALWDLRGPFEKTHPYDARIAHLTEMFRRKKTFSDKSLKEIYEGIKIFDFRTGQPQMTDDEFLDAMLNKISIYGEGSLSWEERKRMRQISEKRAKNNETNS